MTDYKALMFRSPTLGSDEQLYNRYLRKHQRDQNKGQFSKDSERLKVYKAEWAFQSKITTQSLKDVKEAQRYVDKVTGSVTYSKITTKNKGSDIKLRAKKSHHGFGYAGMAYRSEIVLDTDTGLNIYTVLHELAHTAGHRHHGRSFRQALLKLVSRFMGTEQASLLKAEFKASKLPCGEPRKPLTFEKWKAKRERIINAAGQRA